MSDFSEDPVNEAIYGKRGIVGAINLLFDNGCVIPGVMMIMCGIDTMSNLIREHPDKNTSKDFKKWVGKYLRMPGDNALMPDDIWGARNALLHTYGISSEDVRSGKSKIVIWLQNPYVPVWYAPDMDPKSIRVDPFQFKDAFLRGVADFLSSTLSDKNKRPLLEERLKELITYSQFINEELRFRGKR